MNKRIIINDGKNKKYIYDLKDLPDGWEIGGLPTTSGWQWINNGIQEKTIYKDDIIPNGWQKGRLKNKTYITNGVDEKQILKGEPIPKGWYIGKHIYTDEQKQHLSRSHIGEINITDGVNEKHIKSDEPIPDGWYRGKADKTKQKMSIGSKGGFYVTNGTQTKHIHNIEDMPMGWKVGGKPKSEITKLLISKALSGEVAQQKMHDTKKANGTFNTSKPEDNYYEILKLLFDEQDIKRQYRDCRYPFNCDFYIVPEDLFIELNAHWTHGPHPFNPNNKEDQELLQMWRSKANGNNYYDQAIYTWTILDVKKQKIAKENNLNYLTIY